jgi:hypothetical protein
MTRWRSYAGNVLLGFRTETTRSPDDDLAERVRSLEASLRNTRPGDLSAEETHALNGLLQTVHELTLPSRYGHA